MPWPTPALAVLCALLTTAATPAVLRSLPEPLDDPAKLEYRRLIRVPFLLAVFVSMALGTVVGLSLTPPPQAPLWVGFSAGAALLACIDARTGYLPTRVIATTAVLAAGGILAASLQRADPWSPANAVLGAALAAGLFYGLWRLGGGLGFGDVRLAGLIGLVTASESWALLIGSLVLGSLVGVVWGGLAALIRRRDGPFPYGPALIIGVYLALIVRMWAPAA